MQNVLPELTDQVMLYACHCRRMSSVEWSIQQQWLISLCGITFVPRPHGIPRSRTLSTGVSSPVYLVFIFARTIHCFPQRGKWTQHPLFTVFMQHRIVAMYVPRHNSFKVVISPSPLIFNPGGNTVISPGNLVASKQCICITVWNGVSTARQSELSQRPSLQLILVKFLRTV